MKELVTTGMRFLEDDGFYGKCKVEIRGKFVRLYRFPDFWMTLSKKDEDNASFYICKKSGKGYADIPIRKKENRILNRKSCNFGDAFSVTLLKRVTK